MEALSGRAGDAPSARPGSGALAQTVDIETPELVSFSYTIAGVGSRVSAALVDYAICIALFVGLLVGLAYIGAGRLVRAGGTSPEAWALAVVVLGQFLILWGYYVLWEGLADGQTPGKRWMRLRVVSDGGYSVTFGASAVRNLVRIVDMQPVFTYGFGIVSILVTRSGKRLGDLAAGTLVVREEVTHSALGAIAAAPPGDVGGASGVASATEPREDAVAGAHHVRLTDDELAVLERFIERRNSLDPRRRDQLAATLADRFAPALADLPLGDGDDPSPTGRLFELFAEERRARARGAVVTPERGAARERHAIVATGAPRWSSFAARLAQAQRRGLRSLGEEGVREFVAQYRDVAADLARLQTAARGREREEIFYLSRLMAGAHNLLYRGRALTIRDVLRTLSVEAPREVRRSWRPIVLAAALLFGPGAIAYTAVVRDPSVARVFIPRQMLDRAEEGVQRAREARGYITDPQLFRPVMASGIIANNVQVTFAAFALGIAFGLGTAFILVINGVSLGGVFGLYASKGILSLLLAFVAPHGVLELTAICIAGGAGLLLGTALLIPGQRTRRAALKENARRAIRLIAASTVLLLIAGALEGFVSPIETWPLSWKLAVSAVTAVFLVFYLTRGRARRIVVEEPLQPEAGLLELGAP